ncbi:chemotaxis protein CheA [Saccharospirillum mangrovi]|uniref:chemotaxis protein CheA n=1 Tax=Saccharospirillum mangrovi TaxID=2161747 RepID=UPI000D36587C|nr:chemotaxis protein CheA [Saccharospirillum mangrovi]
MNLDSALQTYLEESRELLVDIDQGLLALEADEGDTAEHLNAIFRAAHTIKGSAGLFGLNDIVSFTHVVENVLDLMREGKVTIHSDLISALFRCRDCLAELVETVVAAGESEASSELKAQCDQANQALKKAAGLSDEETPSAVAAVEVEPQTELSDEANGDNPFNDYLVGFFGENLESTRAQTPRWHLSLRFGPNSLRDGMDPLSFLRFLQTLGEIENVIVVDTDLPAIDDFDPETLYLGYEVGLYSQASKEALEDVFEFVWEDSQIHIIPPKSLLSDYIRLIKEAPEADQRLGEILVACGSLTQRELDATLAAQKAISEQGGNARPLGEMLVEQGHTAKPVVEAAVEKQTEVREKVGREQQSIRVDARRLDELINLVGELVTLGAGAVLNARASGDANVIESMSNLTGLVEEVRESALRLRMVPIGNTFERFKRVVRDLSIELDKRIQLRLEGGDTELDKTVVEKINDPLMHLVRNAIDHGIEPESQRLANGKPAEGTVRLNAYHDSGSIVIEVSDDGGGLNAERIRAKAVEKGLIAESQVLEDHELYNLIFEPGFSTAEKVTNVSGRGVGMDVVRSNIEELGGRIQVDSRAGSGSVFRINMPLTLAIIDGFLVQVGESYFVIPLESILECVELDRSQIQVESNRRYINLREEVLPFISLHDLFGISSQKIERENIVVVRSGHQKVGLVVDQLHGEFQTVIKPLGPIFNQLSGISGSTIMGNGGVALIVDVNALISRVISREYQTVSGRLKVYQ